MGASFDLKSMKVSGWGWLLFGGILLLASGFLVLYYPAAGVISIIAVSGSAFIIGGLMNLFLAFQLKNLKREVNRLEDSIGLAKGKYKHA